MILTYLPVEKILTELVGGSRNVKCWTPSAGCRGKQGGSAWTDIDATPHHPYYSIILKQVGGNLRGSVVLCNFGVSSLFSCLTTPPILHRINTTVIAAHLLLLISMPCGDGAVLAGRPLVGDEGRLVHVLLHVGVMARLEGREQRTAHADR